MARRNDHSRDEIKVLAIKAAKELIVEHGLVGCSARKVAKSIDYTVGTLYNIFKNFDDILLHVNAETLEELYQFMLQHIKSELSGSDALKRLAALYIIFVEQNPRLWDALFDHRLPEGIKTPSWYEAKITQLFYIIEKVVGDSTNLNAVEIKRTTKVLWASLHGICSLNIANKLDNITSEPTHLLVEHFIDNYISGITT